MYSEILKTGWDTTIDLFIRLFFFHFVSFFISTKSICTKSKKLVYLQFLTFAFSHERRFAKFIFIFLSSQICFVMQIKIAPWSWRTILYWIGLCMYSFWQKITREICITSCSSLEEVLAWVQISGRTIYENQGFIGKVWRRFMTFSLTTSRQIHPLGHQVWP